MPSPASPDEAIRLACKVWGEPTETIRRGEELRFGKHGSKSLLPRAGVWRDHEAGEGGGVKELYALAGEPFPSQSAIVNTYDYRDERGALLYQVVRRFPHKFNQRRPDASERDGWVWNLRGVRRVLYRLPQLLAADAAETVWIPEGEKDVDCLVRLGLVATCNPGGAGKWRAEFAQHLRGRHVVTLPDNDPVGRDHAAAVARSLRGVAASVVTLELPDLEEKGDVSDWVANGGSAEALRRLADAKRRNGHAQPAYDSCSDTEETAQSGDDVALHELPVIPWVDARLSDLADRETPERQWIIPTWIPRQQVTGLSGVSGCRKTLFLIQLGMAASAGLLFCGYQLEATPVYSLFCEDTADEIQRRAEVIARHYGRRLSDFPDYHFASLVGLDAPEFMTFDGSHPVIGQALKRFDRAILRLGAGLALLDTGAHFFGGNEIIRREATRYVRKLDSISIARNCAIMFAAHPSVRGKAEGTLESGSTGWEGSMRARLGLHDPGEDQGEDDPKAVRIPTDKRILTRHKSNYAKPGEMIELVIRDGVFVPAAVDVEQAKLRQKGPGRAAACEARFLELLERVEEAGDYVHNSPNDPARYAPKALAARIDAAPFKLADFKAAMTRLFVAKKLRLTSFGPPSRGRRKIVAVPP